MLSHEDSVRYSSQLAAEYSMMDYLGSFLRANSPDQIYCDVKVIDSLDSMNLIIENLCNIEVCVLDCEGINLGDEVDSELCTVQIAHIKDEICHIWIIDLVELPKESLNILKEFLENENIYKLMFDCRSDFKAIRELGIVVAGMLDMQAAFVLFRGGRNKNPYLPGFNRVVTCLRFRDSAEVCAIKERGKALFTQSYDIWKIRPIHPDLLEYIKIELIYIFYMHLFWGCEMKLKKLLNVSSFRAKNVATGRGCEVDF